MDGLDVEIMELRAQLERTTVLAQETAAKQLADKIASKAFASLLIPKCADGVGSGVASIFDRTANGFRTHDASSKVLELVADSLEEWASDVRGFGPAVPNADVQYLRQSLYEVAARQAAARIIMVGLAATVGRTEGNVAGIARDIEQTVRDVRRTPGRENREALALIADELSRVADELRRHE